VLKAGCKVRIGAGSEGSDCSDAGAGDSEE